VTYGGHKSAEGCCSRDQPRERAYKANRGCELGRGDTQGSTPGSCPSCAGSQSTRATLPPPYVYAIGQLQPQYPNLSVEKEVAQAIGRGVTTDLTDREALVAVLQDKRNRYLVRQLCWLLIARGLETYLLKPYDPADYDELVRAYAADPKGFVVVVGYRGGTANPQDCYGVILPILIFDNIYFGSKESLLKGLEAPEKVETARFAAAAGEMFDRIVDQIADDGSSDDSRAKLYLAMRSPDIYREAATATVKGLSLRAIRTRPFALNRTSKNIEVIFDYVDRKTNSLEQYSTVINVDGMYPYLVRELAPYFEH
jgi:hypothetical protein